ncbi:unnamed protein product, partial [Ixodes persulcatus]
FFSKKCSCTIVVLLSWLVHVVVRAHCPCSTKQGDYARQTLCTLATRLHLMENKLVHEICVESILIITTWDM